jgi:hypothetical protein
VALSASKTLSQRPNKLVNNLKLQEQNPFHLRTCDIGKLIVGKLGPHLFVVAVVAAAVEVATIEGSAAAVEVVQIGMELYLKKKN